MTMQLAFAAVPMLQTTQSMVLLSQMVYTMKPDYDLDKECFEEADVDLTAVYDQVHHHHLRSTSEKSFECCGRTWRGAAEDRHLVQWKIDGGEWIEAPMTKAIQQLKAANNQLEEVQLRAKWGFGFGPKAFHPDGHGARAETAAGKGWAVEETHLKSAHDAANPSNLPPQGAAQNAVRQSLLHTPRCCLSPHRTVHSNGS